MKELVLQVLTCSTAVTCGKSASPDEFKPKPAKLQ